MKNLLSSLNKISVLILLSLSIAGCARDLSNNVYTSQDTINIVLEGEVLSSREVVIKETERLSDNTLGGGVGALGGGVLASSASNGDIGATIGGAVVGGVVGAATQSALGTTKGIEYLVKVDTSNLQEGYFDGSRLMRNALSAAKATGIITVVQAKEKKGGNTLSIGTKVSVIINEKRVRIIAR